MQEKTKIEMRIAKGNDHSRALVRFLKKRYQKQNYKTLT